MPHLSPPPSHEYRVNFGNGTHAGTIPGRDAAERAMQEQRDYARRTGQPLGPVFLQVKDVETGEWFPASRCARR